METEETLTIPLAPKKIAVSGPVRGRFDMLSNGEQDRFIIKLDELLFSVVVSTEVGDELEFDCWDARIRVLAVEAKRWFGSKESNAKRDALHEWINRDDPEDERLIAIEDAESWATADELFRKIKYLPSTTRRRISALMEEQGF